MSVSTTNKQYNLALPIWNRSRQSEAGSDAIKAQKEVYLPKLGGHDDDDYNSYLKRSVFYNFVGRTANGLKGMVFRKPPVITVNEANQLLIDDVTLDGTSMNDFLNGVVSEVINPSRVGILLDLPDGSTEGMTIAQAESINVRPYLTAYKAENIINWRTEIVDNVKILTMCVIKESVEKVNDKDKYKTDAVVQYRVLELIEGKYSVSIYQTKSDSSEDAELISEITPVVNGKNLNYIPFWIINQNGISNDITSLPVMNDLIDINLAHYINSADYENALHWSGVRTVILAGYPDDKEIKLGGALAVPEDCKVNFLSSPTDDGLTNAMLEKERIMMALGANLISSNSSSVSPMTATGTMIQHQSETSVITDITNNVSVVLTAILRTMVEWATGNVDEESFIKLNIDYNPLAMTGQDALALFDVFDRGGMDRNTYNYNLLKGEIIPASTDLDEMNENIKEEQAEKESNLLGVSTFDNTAE